MRVIVLAAGQGSRLMPLTADRPKCMVVLDGRPLLHHLLRSLRSVGLEDIVVVAGYRADRIDAPGCQLVVNPNYMTTNMVTSLFCASPWMSGDTDVLVCYADTVFEPRVIRTVVEEAEGDLVVASDDCWQALWSRRMPDPLVDAETFRASPDGYLLELGRKPRSIEEVQGQYMGLFKIRRHALPALHECYAGLDREGRYEGRSFDGMFMTALLQLLVDLGWPVKVARTCGGWLEVDSIEDIQFYERCAKIGELDAICELGAPDRT